MAFVACTRVSRKLNVTYSLKQFIFPSMYRVANSRGYLKCTYSETADSRVTKQSSLLVMQRSYSSSKDLQYEDLLELKKKDVILIDVREHHEIEETGKLPGSINIPLGELKSGLESTSEIFENKYGIKKPSPEMTICFSCRSGKRSKMALDIALNLGFSNACHYAGGFLDWQKHNPS